MVSDPAQARGGLLRRVVAYVIVSAFVVLCGYYLWSNWDEFRFVASVSLVELVAPAALVLLTFLVNAWQLGLFLKNFGVRPRWQEVVSVSMGMLLGNMVTPMRAGTGGLALYLRSVYRLDFQAFAAIYGGTALLAALTNSGMAMIGVLVLWLYHGYLHLGLAVFVTLMFSFCLYLSVFPPRMESARKGIIGIVYEVGHSWHVLTRNRWLLGHLILSTVVIALASMGAFHFIYSSFGMPLSLWAVLVTSSMGTITNLVPLTPGSLGIFDSVVIQIPQLFGLDPARSIAGALVFRVLSFGWAFALGVPGMIYFLRATRRLNACDGQSADARVAPASDSGSRS